MNAPFPLSLLQAGEPTGDVDPAETQEWREAFDALLATQGPDRARFMLDELIRLEGPALPDPPQAVPPRQPSALADAPSNQPTTRISA